MSNPTPDSSLPKPILCDTTLRDGTQSVGITFSVEDKIRILKTLARDLEVPYIEAGWPGANPKDSELYQHLAGIDLGASRVVAFGATRRPGLAVEEDALLQELAAVPTDHVTLVGKAWTLQVEKALQTSREENLAMIEESIAFLVQQGKQVFFDAEHFFDGYQDDPNYALQTLEAATRAGAACLVLCDTNGGMLPHQVGEVTERVTRTFDTPLGIHAHDDAGFANANALSAYRAGATHIQCTINGWGERCGNTDLIVAIPTFQLKLGLPLLPEDKLRNLREVSHFVYELANMKPAADQPYVGTNAFAHKGGLHISAMLRDIRTYEHIEPQLVGNDRNIKVSELAGRSSILNKARQLHIHLDPNNPKIDRILEVVKEKEKQGFSYEGADGSLEIIMRSIDMNIEDPEYFQKQFFSIEGFRVHSTNTTTEATVKVCVKGKEYHTAAEGNGPVNAIDNALRKALAYFYPSLKDIELSDFKVRIIRQAGTGSSVRVWVETRDQERAWGTVGSHTNIIVASWQALIDAYVYKLLKDQIKWT